MKGGCRTSMAFGCAMLVACQAPPELPDVVWSGEYYDFATNADPDAVCRGTLPYSDEVAGHLLRTIGVHPEQRRLRLNWVPDEDEYGEFCRTPSIGCISRPNVAVSKWPHHQHELVHLVRGRSFLPVTEGLAEYLGDDLLRVPGGDIEETLAGDASDAVSQTRLAHFMSYLDAKFGRDAVLELDQRSRKGASYAETDALAMSVFGATLSAIIPEYLDEYPDCPTHRFRDNLVDCERDVESLGTDPDGVFEKHIPISCDDESTIGPRDGKIWRYQTIEVQTEGSYRIDLFTGEGQEDQLIQVSRCGGSCFEPTRVEDQLRFLVNEDACLTPGRYLFRFLVDESRVTTFRLAIETLQFRPCDEE